jgi:hypothetical protein
VPSDTTVTIEDLAAIADRASGLDDPSPVVAELVAAVDQGRVADEEAAVHALLLASEMTELAGDLPAALGLAGRAAALPPESGFARACYAELLVKSGREQEGLEQFAAVRPELLRDPLAPAYVGESLEACGLGDVAQEWLTAAAQSALDVDEPDFTGIELLFELVKERHRIRETLELAHDDMDGLYHQMDAAAEGSDHAEGQALLFWPEPELAGVLARWPERADIYGPDWDAHRAGVERTLAGWSASGMIRIGLIAGTVDGLLAYAAGEEADPADPEVHADYADETAHSSGAVEWPPQRNASCWCASGAKYKKCCLPRSRA